MSKVKKFLDEMNKILNPVLQVVYLPRGSAIRFEVKLCETKYAMIDQVVITDDMDELIINTFNSVFGCNPSFNNTHRVFWTCVKPSDFGGGDAL